MARKKINTNSLRTCPSCKDNKIITEYFTTDSNLFNGVIPICKECIKKKFLSLVDMYNDCLLALIHLCFNLDIPFDYELAVKIIETDNLELSFSYYLEKIFSNKGKRISTNIETAKSVKMFLRERVKGESIEKQKENVEDSKTFEVTEKMTLRWGDFYTVKDIEFLESKFNEFLNFYGGNTPAHYLIYENLSKNLLNLRVAEEEGDLQAIEKLTKMQQQLMDSGKLKPKQETNDESSTTSLGQLFDMVEKYKPVGSVSEEYKDVDGIKKLFKTEFVDAMKRSVRGGVFK